MCKLKSQSSSTSSSNPQVLSDKFGLPIDLIKRKLPYCKWSSKNDIIDGIVPARRPSQILLYLEGRGFSQAQVQSDTEEW